MPPLELTEHAIPAAFHRVFHVALLECERHFFAASAVEDAVARALGEFSPRCVLGDLVVVCER